MSGLDDMVRAIVRQELENATAARWLTVRAAADRASVSLGKVREWIRLGDVEHNGVSGKGSRVLASSVDRAVRTSLGRNRAADLAEQIRRRRMAS